MGKRKADWQDIKTLLAYFGKRRREAVQKYEEFLEEGVSQGRRPELVGGGLIRSMGGWSQVLSLRRKGDQVPSDQRILGSGEFVEEVLLQAEKREKETLGMSRRVRGLDERMREMVKGERIEEGGLRSGGRGERGDSGEEAILSVSGEEDGVCRGGGSALFGGDDFRREPAGRFGGIPGVAQICLSCFRTYVPFHTLCYTPLHR